MKLKTLTVATLLAAGAAVAFTTNARAALTYTAGDLFLGFRGTSATSDYLVNLGNISQFSQLNGASFTVAMGGDISADLVSAFTASWNTSSTVSWGAIGTTFDGSPSSVETIYATRGRNALNINTQTSPILGNSPSAQSQITSLIGALAGKYTADGVATTNSTKGTFQTASAANSWFQLTKTSADFNLGVNIDGATFSNTGGRLGTATSVLDLYKIDPVTDQPGTYLGKFTINDNAVITFTSAVSAVPEPSTYGMILGALLAFIAFRRARHRKITA